MHGRAGDTNAVEIVIDGDGDGRTDEDPLDFAESIAVLKEGLRITPGHARGALLLATLLTSCPDRDLRDPARAVLVAERVSRALGNQSVDALLVLAAAQAETGDLPAAVESAREALGVAAGGQSAAQLAKVRQRLDNYLSLLDEI